LPVYTLLRRSLIAQPTQTDISAVEKWFDDNRQPFPSFPPYRNGRKLYISYASHQGGDNKKPRFYFFTNASEPNLKDDVALFKRQS
jgi:hypothetical protein